MNEEVTVPERSRPWMPRPAAAVIAALGVVEALAGVATLGRYGGFAVLAIIAGILLARGGQHTFSRHGTGQMVVCGALLSVVPPAVLTVFFIIDLARGATFPQWWRPVALVGTLVLCVALTVYALWHVDPGSVAAPGRRLADHEK